MTLDLTKAKELAEKATPGPWPCWSDPDISCQIIVDGLLRPVVVASDAEFISFSRAFVPEAIEEIERLREEPWAYRKMAEENEALRKRLELAEPLCDIAVEYKGKDDFRWEHGKDGPRHEDWLKYTQAVNAWRDARGGG